MRRLFYILQIAVKDAYQNISSLSILGSCCFIGTLALVSISLLKESVDNSINDNTKSLLAADFLITNRQPPSKDVDLFLAGLANELGTKITTASETSLASMVLFKSSAESRLIQLSAVSDSYPLYGEVKTSVGSKLKIKSGEALVDNNLKVRYDLKIGDEIKIGNKYFIISDFILQMPGSLSSRSILAPRVLINSGDIIETNLIKRGSLVRYLFYVKTEENIRSEVLKEKLSDKIMRHNLSLETTDEKRASIEKTVAVAYNFLDVITFLSFILGGIGIASGSFIYFRKKREFIQTLICLGLKKREAVIFFSTQILLFGLLAIGLASTCGLLIHNSLPELLAEYLPIKLSNAINFIVYFKAICTSIILLILCASLAALFIWKEGLLKNWINAIAFLCAALVIVFFWGKLITNNLLISSIYTVSIFVIIACLALSGFSLRYLSKRIAARIAKFEFEQGIKNLYRPNNQTFLLFSTIGVSALSVFLSLFISTLAGNKITKINEEGSSNLLLFDIQEYQTEGVKQLMLSNELPVIETFPIISMRIEKINGFSVAEIRKKQGLSGSTKPRWTLTREYRSTYKTNLDESEEVIAGEFIGLTTDNHQLDQKIPVSIEEGLAEKLDLKMADTILFNIQGLPVKTYISSIRKVDWQQMKPNFFFVFPSGVLEDAPKTSIILSKYSTEIQNSIFQSELTKSFGNVSSIDLTLLLRTITAISDQIKNIIDFLSLILIANSAVILTGIILGSRTIRIEENTILRTLGAKDRVINTITAIEYAVIAIFGTASGLVLAIIASILIGINVFDVLPVFNLFEIVSLFFLFILSIAFFGILGSSGTLKRSTLETLRTVES